MNRFSQALQNLKDEAQFRQLREIESPQERLIRHEGVDYLNFSSNNYLGLANHPEVKKAFMEGVEKYGVGSGASRLINGSLAPFHRLEEKIAAWKNTPAALVFNSGYHANLGVLSALLREGDVVFSDALNHASLIDGIKLSRAQKVIFRHQDYEDLERRLSEISASPQTLKLIVTESVFSMDGDLSDLQILLDLSQKYDAYLYLDEAHATGVFGERAAGCASLFREHPAFSQRLIQMETLGKALGVFGAYVAASRDIIDFLINRSRPFIYTTALPPAVACAALKAIELAQAQDLGLRLWDHLKNFQKLAAQEIPDWNLKVESPIIPLILKSASRVLEASEKLRQEGFWVTAIRPPTVPVDSARLRITLMATHRTEDLEKLVAALKKLFHGV